MRWATDHAATEAAARWATKADVPALADARVKAGRDRPAELGRGRQALRDGAVRQAAPASRLILDANEGWTPDNLENNLAIAASLGVALVEQPLPAGRDSMLGEIDRPVPVCADESVHEAEDLDQLAGLYDRGRELGFRIMVGCMVGTSLGMAPAVLLAQGAEFVDLDGPLLLARDRVPGLIYRGSLVSPPEPALWG